MSSRPLSEPVLESLLEASPMGVILVRMEELADDRSFRTLYINRAAERMLGMTRAQVAGTLAEANSSGLRQRGFIERFVRVIRSGQPEVYEDAYYADDRLAAAFSGYIERIAEDSLAIWFENTTERKKLEAEAAKSLALAREAEDRSKLLAELENAHAEQRKAEAELRERIALVESQRDLIDELSAPILDVWEDVIALPIVGALDDRRAASTMMALLEEISRQGARFALVDLTGVEAVDAATAEHVVRIAQAVDLLGAHVIITGVQPSVAKTFVELGVDLSKIESRQNLRQGIAECMARLRRTRK